MNDSRAQIRFERWWSRGVLAFVALFLLIFMIAEQDGLISLVEYIFNAIGRLPQALSDLGAYFSGLAGDVLGASLLTGGVFGALATLTVIALPRLGLVMPPLPLPAYLGGAVAGVLMLMSGWSPLAALVLAYIVTWLAAALLMPAVRHSLLSPAASLFNLSALAEVLSIAAAGAVAGAFGSQILTTVTRHCTYLPEAPLAEWQIGQALTMVSALILLFPLWTFIRRRGVKQNHASSGYFRNPALPYVLLLPTLASLVLFLYAPSIQSLMTSLMLRRFPLPQEQFVCLRNYVSLANDVIYRSSFTTTLLMTLAIVGFSLGVSLLSAVLASQKVRFASIYRTLLIWPFALSPVVTGTVFLAMFRDGGSGLINTLLMPLGISVSWLRDANLAPWVIVAASVWNILGFNILFYIAGLQNVPKDLLEAAEIDGANRVQRFRRITVPMLAPYTFFLLVTNVTYAFYGVYGAIDALTQGGPPLGPAGSLGGATNALIYKLYQDGFAPGAPLGMASAQAVILFVMVAGLTLLQFRVIEARISYGE